jgi:molybdopterin-dependent oxidoreductase alpha subunit
MLMLGQIAKPGAGLCPVRGHSNVQGDRTMGIWEKPKDAFLDALKARYDFEPPRHHGHDTVGAIAAMLEGRARVFFALGGNFLSASPDTAATAQALERCALSVHVATKLNRAHLHVGETALILPTLSRVEKDLQASGLQMVSVEDSMAVVHRSQGLLRPASPLLLSEVAIIARLAARCCPEAKVDWLSLCADYDRIRDEIEAVIPGFERFNMRLRQPDGFVLPKELSATFKFVSHTLPDLALAKGQLRMMTIRSHDQFNTSVYSSNDRYRGIKGSRWVLLMNEADIAARGLKEGVQVTVTSHFRGEQRHLHGMRVVPYDLPLGCAASYFPEANALVPLLQHDPKSRTPASKSLVISVGR